MATHHGRCSANQHGGACCVPPHPRIAGQIREALNRLRAQDGAHAAAPDGVPADGRSAPALPPSLLRALLKKQPGRDDGLLLPPNQAAARAVNAARKNTSLRGKLRMVVVMVDFADQKFTAAESPEHFRNLFFGEGPGTVRHYYQEVSGGLVSFEGEVVGPVRAPHKIKEYAHGKSGDSPERPNVRTMALDVAKLADPQVNFKDFVNLNSEDGAIPVVDGFVIVHAGPGAEETADPDAIWSLQWNVEGDVYSTKDGANISAFLTVPANCRVGVCVHEIGHLVFGFPDLYDIDREENETTAGLGDWCLMAGGSWNGPRGEEGTIPAHPSAWCKADQGWVLVKDFAGNETVMLPDVKTSRMAVRLSSSGENDLEYFLLENRQRTSGTYDAALPGEGLLVWHVDEAVQEQRDEKHYIVAMIQADQRKDLEKKKGGNQGDSGDPFPGSTNARSVKLVEYGGRATGIEVTEISKSGAEMQMRLVVPGRGGRTSVAPRAARAVDAIKAARADVHKAVHDTLAAVAEA